MRLFFVITNPHTSGVITNTTHIHLVLLPTQPTYIWCYCQTQPTYIWCYYQHNPHTSGVITNTTHIHLVLLPTQHTYIWWYYQHNSHKPGDKADEDMVPGGCLSDHRETTMRRAQQQFSQVLDFLNLQHCVHRWRHHIPNAVQLQPHTGNTRTDFKRKNEAPDIQGFWL